MPIGDSPAKLTKDAKAAIQIVFEDLGGISRLTEWANQPGNLGTFYTQIWSKIIPKDIKAEVDGSITVEIQQFGETTKLTHNSHTVIETVGEQITDAIISQEDEENGTD
jgi:hypothetical protein